MDDVRLAYVHEDIPTLLSHRTNSWIFTVKILAIHVAIPGMGKQMLAILMWSNSR